MEAGGGERKKKEVHRALLFAEPVGLIGKKFIGFLAPFGGLKASNMWLRELGFRL